MACWCLFSTREVWSKCRSKDYECVLKTVANQNGYTFDPNEIMIDFELAVKKSILKRYAIVLKLLAAYFISKSLFKMFFKMRLKQLYMGNEDVQVWFKSVFCLSLIPQANVEQQFSIYFFYFLN